MSGSTGHVAGNGCDTHVINNSAQYSVPAFCEDSLLPEIHSRKMEGEKEENENTDDK